MFCFFDNIKDVDVLNFMMIEFEDLKVADEERFELFFFYTFFIGKQFKSILGHFFMQKIF